MNIAPSRVVIAVGLVIVGGGLVTYALHSPTPAPIARVAPLAPPPAQTAEVPPPATPATPAADTAAGAPTDTAPPPVAQTDSSSATTSSDASVAPVPEPKATRHAKSHDGSRSSEDTVASNNEQLAPVSPAAAPTNDQSVAKNTDSVKAPDESAAPTVPAVSAATPAQDSPATDVANADVKITTEVKSALAADSVTKDANISVNTTQGVVVVSGTVPNQDAADHVKMVAQNVPDVKSVDTSALKVSG